MSVECVQPRFIFVSVTEKYIDRHRARLVVLHWIKKVEYGKPQKRNEPITDQCLSYLLHPG
ncbi:hypothetical protein KDA_50790 [Dictyobacter alpinus]|uniref:Uncharacterized protein n=1 Tax=Dictyobacter alpinus TaxID=2014873 RepID=A0A402BE10_9CHLR|nr:hypothetical protein KDA_50790 [Dictyobacter alpinus]